jgi:hypothetical protein
MPGSCGNHPVATPSIPVLVALPFPKLSPRQSRFGRQAHGVEVELGPLHATS